MDLTRLGAAMRAIALRPEFWDELGDFGYMDGGCRIYAEAARTYLGSSSEIAFVIVEGSGIGPIVDHALVVYGEHAFDGDGAAPIDGYLSRYEELEQRGEMLLELLHADEVAEERDLARQVRDLPLNTTLSRRLAAAWRAELGDPR